MKKQINSIIGMALLFAANPGLSNNPYASAEDILGDPPTEKQKKILMQPERLSKKRKAILKQKNKK